MIDEWLIGDFEMDKFENENQLGDELENLELFVLPDLYKQLEDIKANRDDVYYVNDYAEITDEIKRVERRINHLTEVLNRTE
jgi:hypothetical protein